MRALPCMLLHLSQPLITFYSYGDRYVKFTVPQEQKSSQPTDAVSILMRPQEANHQAQSSA